MRWLLKRGWMYLAMIVGLGVRAVPRLLGRDHVAEAAVGDLHAHARPVAVPTRSGTQYPRVLGEGHVGRALMNSLIVAARDDGHLPDRRRAGRLRARALPRARSRGSC